MTSSFLTSQPREVIWKYLNDHIGVVWSTDFVGIARVRGSTILGAVGYNNFNQASCQMHWAATDKRWLTREFIREAFRYPFEQLDLTMVLAVVPSGNIGPLDQTRRIGFKDLIYIPGAHEDGGLYMLQMLREDCRWLRTPNGQEVTSLCA